MPDPWLGRMPSPSCETPGQLDIRHCHHQTKHITVISNQTVALLYFVQREIPTVNITINYISKHNNKCIEFKLNIMTTLSKSMDARGQRRVGNFQTIIRDRGTKTDQDSDRRLGIKRRRSASMRLMTSCGGRLYLTRTSSPPRLTHSFRGRDQQSYLKWDKS